MLHQNIIENSGFRGLDSLEIAAVSGGVVSFRDGTAQSHNGKDDMLPTTWEETTWGEAMCVVGGMAIGLGPIATDVACDTDLSGSNPHQNGLTDAERLEREKAAIEEGIDALIDGLPQ